MKLETKLKLSNKTQNFKTKIRNTKYKYLFHISQLPHLGFFYCWKFQEFSETFKAGFDKMLRNIQAEGRTFFTYKKNVQHK